MNWNNLSVIGMAGLLAWAADVVGGAHHADGSDFQPGDASGGVPLIFTDEQREYYYQLERKAASLNRAIRDLRIRLPPPDVSQRLPHLVAHSVASHNALALQLNAHSDTREQTQLREVTLLEENAAYQRAIPSCETKIQESKREKEIIQRKLEAIEAKEFELRRKFEDENMSMDDNRPSALPLFSSSTFDSIVDSRAHTEAETTDMLQKVENKKRELSAKEEQIQKLGRQWEQMQEKVLKVAAPAQREKLLERQLHSLIEQLAAKQSQTESLASAVHAKQIEVGKLDAIWRQLESSNSETSTAKNRFGRNSSQKGSVIPDKPLFWTNSRTERQFNIQLMRSAFVVYILFLHLLVFLKMSVLVNK